MKPELKRLVLSAIELLELQPPANINDWLSEISTKEILSAAHKMRFNTRAITAKNFLIQRHIELQTVPNNSSFFEVGNPWDSKENCSNCSGIGFIPYFEVKHIEEKCDDCNGTGVKAFTCRACNGQDSSNCKICKGSGKYFLFRSKDRKKSIPCRKCTPFELRSKVETEKGTGKVTKVMIPAGRITSISSCNHCRNTGKKFIGRINPVIHEEVGAEIKEKISLEPAKPQEEILTNEPSDSPEEKSVEA